MFKRRQESSLEEETISIPPQWNIISLGNTTSSGSKKLAVCHFRGISQIKLVKLLTSVLLGSFQNGTANQISTDTDENRLYE